MAIEDVLARISSIQARFGVGSGASASEFEGVLSDAARHAGVSPTDRIDEQRQPVTAEPAALDVEDRTGTASDPVGAETPPAAEPATDGAGAATADDAVVSLLDELATSADGPSGEALEALSAAAAPALSTAAALGATGSSSLLDVLQRQVGGADGTAILASIIAQQQAGIGISRPTGS